MIGSFEVALSTLRGSAETIHSMALGLITSFALVAFLFSSLRALIFASGSALADWTVRMGLVLIMMWLYFDVVRGAVEASNELSDYFGRHSEVMSAWQSFGSQLADTATDERRGVIDRLKGVFKTLGLAHVVVVSQFAIAMAFLLVRQLAAVVLSVMYCLGPLVIAAGVFDAKVIKAWLVGLIHVLLWPVVPPLALMLVTHAGLADAAIDNVGLTIAQNLCLAAVAFISPFIVGFLFGKSGAGSAAAIVTGLAATALTKAVTGPATKIATKVAEKGGGAAALAAGGATGAAAGAVGGASAGPPVNPRSVGSNRPEPASRSAPAKGGREAPRSSHQPEPTPDGRAAARPEGVRAVKQS